MVTRRELMGVLENLRSAKMAIMSAAMAAGNDEFLYSIVDRDLKPAMERVEYLISVATE